VGASLPVSFYQEIEADLANGVVFFLEYQEQDQGIRTKKEAIISALTSSKVKSIALEQEGILSASLNGLRSPKEHKRSEIKTFPAKTTIIETKAPIKAMHAPKHKRA
jgi:hypothetical protein